jgi:predicted Zn-ribbon and HTH transcriptional regulator
MTNMASVGSVALVGPTYRCSNCGYELDTRGRDELPVCPDCKSAEGWEVLSGDSPEHYPDTD